MNKKILMIIGVIVLVIVVGASGFWGGMAYKTSKNNQVQASFFEQRGGRSTNGQLPSGTPFPGGPATFDQTQGAFRGGGTMGEVKSIDGNTLTISTAQDVTTVNLTDTTTILKSVEGSTSDLQPGMRVMVTGERDDQGNITAAQITIMSNNTLVIPTRTAP